MRNLLASCRCWLVAVLLSLLPMAEALSADATAGYSLGTAFTYQGRLQQGGRPAEGLVDFAFELFDSATGGRSFGVVDQFDLEVHEGAFAVELDFGQSVASGEAYWLEIQVRPAGEGSYAVLDPRHRLAGAAVSACTVNSNVQINGTVDIDAPGNAPELRIACCNDVDTGGQLAIGGFLDALLFDDNEIQAKLLNNPGPLSINAAGGNVGIRVANPQAPLNLPGSPDVSPGSGGVLVIGSPAGNNIAMDNNEIMARNNGSTSTLYMNPEGGTVQFGGPIDIGYQVVTFGGGCTGAYKTAICPSGTRVLGGGCLEGDESYGYPTNGTWNSGGGNLSYTCHFEDCDGSAKAMAICANIR